MIDREKLEAHLAELPLYAYFFIDPQELEFTRRVRLVCELECPRYNRTWACPPAVGSVESCRGRCLGYENCLMMATVTEVADIADLDETLATRGDHETVTNEVRGLFREMGVEPYILSTEACDVCDRCAWLDGQPCRHPEHMHPCLESHGINLVPTLEKLGLEFQYGGNVVTWYSLLFY